MTTPDGLVDTTRPLLPGPALATVMQRIATTPADRLPAPGTLDALRPQPGRAVVDPTAVVADAVADLAPTVRRTHEQLTWLRTFFSAPGDAGPARGAADVGDLRARAALVTTWVLEDPALRATPALAEVLVDGHRATDWALTVVWRVGTVLAPVLDPLTWPSTTATREESARAVLRACGLHPGDESAVDAEARWQTVSTAIQRVVLAQLAEEAQRTEELQRALAARRAKEAAAQVSHV